MAEDTARELPNLSLEDALRLVHLYGEKESPKYERAAMRWLERWLTESSPKLDHFARFRFPFSKTRHDLGSSSPRAPREH
jgi:hypothetical protein